MFSVKNQAWASLKDGSEGRIKANFYSKGELTDSWNLAVDFYNTQESGPGFRFMINRAANDRASFISQFSSADVLSFFRDEVPLGTFTLRDSGGAIRLLTECRNMLRADPHFDPFAD